MEHITIEVSDEKIVVVQGQSARARLVFLAAGLSIWVKGSSKYHHTDCIPNLAMNACLDRHIPLISLRRQK